MATPSPAAAPAPSGRLARFAWFVLAYNLVVIAWGAFVRASGSGAGCGRHWPLCNGEVVPRPKSIATIIEAGHRATSGLALIFVCVLAVWVFRAFPKGDRARRAAAFTTFFMFGEALVGAGLVLFELVAHDASMKRALSMILHLGNTFLLLGALSITTWTIHRARTSPPPAERTSRSRFLTAVLTLALLAVLGLGSSGAVAALGDTLFPARSLAEGLAQDLSPVAHVFLRLRLLHPFIALATGVLVLGAAGLARLVHSAPRVRRFSHAVTALFVIQFCAGLVNVTLLAPIWMQLVHLLLADATWISLVLLGWEATYGDGALVSVQPPIMSRNGPGPMSEVPPSMSNVDPVTYAPAGDTR